MPPVTSEIPYIDPNVEHVGVSKLRTLSGKRLRSFEKTLVIQENDTPLAVLLNYRQFLNMQNQLRAVLETIDLLTDEEEASALRAGLAAAASGRTKSLDRIKRERAQRRRRVQRVPA